LAFYWTLQQLVQATNAELILPAGKVLTEEFVLQIPFAKAVTDSRAVSEEFEKIQANTGKDEKTSGVLYIAIVGERFDGHRFVESAIEQGAVAVLVSSLVDSCPVPQVLVDDTRIALGEFAKWHRLQMPVKAVVGITGSNGKTTTKTMIADLLQTQGATLMTQGNLNNDFGVPRTLLELRPEHEFAVVEMGANHVGEIRYLTNLVTPDIALLNNAAGAHLEGFGSLNGVIEGKGEIFEGIRKDSDFSVAILNADSPGIEVWRKKVKQLKISQAIEFSQCDENSVRSSEWQNVCWQDSKKQTSTSLNCFDLNFSSGKTLEIAMPLIGQHNAYNAAACAAVGQALSIPMDAIQTVLNRFSGVSGRLQTEILQFGQLIDDSYNANPASVKAGIDVLAQMDGLGIICLGAMAELGEGAAQAHLEIARYAAQKGIHSLFFKQSGLSDYPVAETFLGSTIYSEKQSMVAQEFSEHDALIARLKVFIDSQIKSVGQNFRQQEKTLANSVLESQEFTSLNILVKGSRSAQMELVAQALRLSYALSSE